MNPERFLYGAEFAPFDLADGSDSLPSKSRREKSENRRKLVSEAKDRGFFEKLTEPQRVVLDALTVGKIRTYRDVAFERGTTPQAVFEIAQSGLKNLENLKHGEDIKCGKKRIKFPFEDSNSVITSWYLDEGLSTQDIGNRLGCSLSTVARRLRESGVELRKHGPRKVIRNNNDLIRDALPDQILEMKVGQFNFGAASRSLERYGLTDLSVGELSAISDDYLMSLKGIGEVKVNTIRSVIAKLVNAHKE